MRRLLLAFLLLGCALRAEATDYTGLWFNAAQPGYGFNFAQSDDYLFGTFFIYGQGGTPTWYVAGLTRGTDGAYTGNLGGTKGTWFAQPWNPASFVGTVVGTATFTPSAGNAYDGTLTLAVNGLAPITYPITRQTLTTIALGGAYNGGQSGAYTGCTVASDNWAYIERYDLQVTHRVDNTATFLFKYTDGLTCTLSGALQPHGALYQIDNASYVCTDGTSATARVSEIRATSIGIEGRYSAPSVGGGCAETASFSAVLN
jgi:hypothetical protein